MIHRIPSVRRRGRRGAPTVVLGTLLTLALGACEFPTELPKWDTTWIVPAENTTISVAKLLPSTIGTTPGDTSFVLSLEPVTVSRTLEEICGTSCTLLNGLTVPKPPFRTSFGSSIALPSDVVSAQITGGNVQISMEHDFPFDPIQPGGAERGYVVVTAMSGSTLLAKDSIAGETTAFAPGTTLDRVLMLAPATVSDSIKINIVVSSPLGDSVTIDTTDRLIVTATPTQIQVSQAQVRIASRTIDATDVELDLGEIDETVTENVKAGALLLTLSNPFAVTGNLTLTITAPGTTITKSVALEEGASTARVEFNQQEIQSILGTSPVRLRVSGALCASAPCTTTVTPSQTVTIGSQLELTIGPKEN